MLPRIWIINKIKFCYFKIDMQKILHLSDGRIVRVNLPSILITLSLGFTYSWVKQCSFCSFYYYDHEFYMLMMLLFVSV